MVLGMWKVLLLFLCLAPIHSSPNISFLIQKQYPQNPNSNQRSLGCLIKVEGDRMKKPSSGMCCFTDKENRIDWNGVIPLRLECPNCKRISNLPDNKWKYVDPRTPEPLKDYHLCPICEQMWSILIAHIDSISVVINWEEPIPIKKLCPLCQHYSNLHPEEWQIYLPKVHTPLKDVHICPKCTKLWRILRFHFEVDGVAGTTIGGKHGGEKWRWAMKIATKQDIIWNKWGGQVER